MRAPADTKRLMAESSETIDMLKRLTVRLEAFNDQLEKELNRLEHPETPDVGR